MPDILRPAPDIVRLLHSLPVVNDTPLPHFDPAWLYRIDREAEMAALGNSMRRGPDSWNSGLMAAELLLNARDIKANSSFLEHGHIKANLHCISMKYPEMDYGDVWGVSALIRSLTNHNQRYYAREVKARRWRSNNADYTAYEAPPVLRNLRRVCARRGVGITGRDVDQHFYIGRHMLLARCFPAHSEEQRLAYEYLDRCHQYGVSYFQGMRRWMDFTAILRDSVIESHGIVYIRPSNAALVNTYWRDDELHTP